MSDNHKRHFVGLRRVQQLQNAEDVIAPITNRWRDGMVNMEGKATIHYSRPGNLQNFSLE